MVHPDGEACRPAGSLNIPEVLAVDTLLWPLIIGVIVWFFFRGGDGPGPHHEYRMRRRPRCRCFR